MVNRRVPEAGNMQKCFVSLRPNCSLAIWTQLKGTFLHITSFEDSVCWHALLAPPINWKRIWGWRQGAPADSWVLFSRPIPKCQSF